MFEGEVGSRVESLKDGKGSREREMLRNVEVLPPALAL